MGHYRVVEKIGQGGMGVVYRAEDTSLGRTVALKFLPSNVGLDDRAEDRLFHEARAASALDHANIATIHDIGRTDSGQLYIVMAFYDGRTLESVIEDGPLPIERAVEYARQIAAGLERAWEEGIIHRDIKPANLMITPRGAVKILDFGLAKVEDVQLTLTGATPGTPAYMSPEGLSGEPVDHRSDLWALGVVLHEMLTGENPFSRSNPAATVFAVTQEQPPRVDSIRGDVPRWLCDVLDNLLDKDSNLRTQTATELLAAITDRDSTTSDRGRRRKRRRTAGPAIRFVRPLPATILALGVLATWWWLGSSEEMNPTLDRASAREATRAGIEYFTAGRLDLAQAELERALISDSTYAEAWSTLSAVHLQQHDYVGAKTAAAAAVALDSANAVAHYNLGLVLHEEEDWAAGAKAYRQAIRFDSSFTAAYSALSDLLIEGGDPEGALEVLDRGERVSEGSPYRFLLLKNVGKARIARGEYADAVLDLEKSLDLQEWPETAALLSEALQRLGRLNEADEHWLRYLTIEPDSSVLETTARRLGR